jgi:aspartyl-tRNA(Asn)/glutamyl-tRNA(Gln) amidotransferase subunit A
MADRGTSSVELVQRSLDAIHEREHELNAFVYIAPESALLEEAAALDVERERSGVRGPLHGVPVSIKDIIHVKGMKTTASSAVLPDYMPEEDATVVCLLRKAGAIIVGKTHTHEFALGVTTAQSRNPWDITRDPGGSSGGSAISISTGMSLLGVGNGYTRVDQGAGRTVWHRRIQADIRPRLDRRRYDPLLEHGPHRAPGEDSR